MALITEYDYKTDEQHELIYEAATALPHYITALSEAERALEKAHVTTFPEMKARYINEALTTIRQLARGKE